MLSPITHDERLQSMTDQGYEVLYDPPGDGNCHFFSVAFALDWFLYDIGLRRERVSVLVDLKICKSLKAKATEKK